MAMNELEMFLSAWDREAESPLKLLRALPATQYDFRPDAGGRSLGELAWHLAEGDAYMSYGIETGRFAMDVKPPNIERPRVVEALAPGTSGFTARRSRESANSSRRILTVRSSSSMVPCRFATSCGPTSFRTASTTAANSR